MPTSNVQIGNALDYGLIADNSTDNSGPLNTLIGTTIGPSTVAQIYFPAGSYIFGSNVTVPTNIAVELRPGAVLKFSNPNVQIIFNGDLIIDHSQTAFVAAVNPLRNQVLINSKNLRFVSPRWWGAKGDTRFNTSADNAAIS